MLYLFFNWTIFSKYMKADNVRKTNLSGWVNKTFENKMEQARAFEESRHGRHNTSIERV